MPTPVPGMKIRRLLIANRGEIAVRIARTCARLGIETVAIYSDADRRALHVRAADLACHVGPPEAARSYLDQQAILDAARAADADAIHPGYGFLSENAAFAEACTRAGIAFVGPPPGAIREMGSKQHSRALAVHLGVPIVPGFEGTSQEDTVLAGEARRIGFPLLVKASAGGGGRGIRVVARPGDLAGALATARHEAQAAFGDTTLVLERFLERARHVEVQVVADRHGNCVALFDRECSLQRNHQKLIEEAPAPRLSAPVREGLRDCALRIARAIGYESAGTVEFLVDDAADRFFFLEMNTRLQVEHPTTELVAGVDLVELQLRIANGEPLPAGLGTAEPNGTAIEARICAERPDEGFLPSTGVVRRFRVPAIEGIRLDSGIDDGSVVTAYYDSMLAKLIVHGRDREEARARLVAALDKTVLAGVDSNLDFLRDLLATEAFRGAAVWTGLVEGEPPRSLPADPMDAVAAAAAWVLDIERPRLGTVSTPWDRLGPWRVTGRSGRRSWTSVELRAGAGDSTSIRLCGSDGCYDVEAEELHASIRAWWAPDGDLRIEADGMLHRRSVALDGETVWISGGRRHSRFTVVSRDARAAAGEAAAAASDSRNLVAPFPGLITSVAVETGAHVEKGSLLVVMEAMKMVHSLRAAGSGAVLGVHCRPGRTVAAGDLLVEFEATS
jgi:3-methylcrotonyl-CoA carboxylase alpha subunit